MGHIKVLPDQLSELFQTAINRWRNIKDESKESLLNALYFHTKSTSYHWGYERFFVDYLALDALWLAGESENLWTKKSRRYIRHGKEKWASKSFAMIQKLETYFKNRYFGGPEYSVQYCKNLLYESHVFDKSRNKLFHEGKWDNNNRISITYKKMIVFKLHRHLQRLILGYLGIQNNYTCSPWWTMGRWSWI